ncbi:MAG: hypothetical protein AB4290_03740, partial [Spirulina sp.]
KKGGWGVGGDAGVAPQMRDAVNKAARIVVNHCLKNGIGCIVFGWNSGAKNNQKFVQIPTAKLKDRIKQLCE